jgi:hypothetical protein
MKFLIFNRESNNFDDILQDVKTHKIKHKISFLNHLNIGFSYRKEKEQSLFILKYGDDMIDFGHIVPDRSPVMYRDYIPKKK